MQKLCIRPGENYASVTILIRILVSIKQKAHVRFTPSPLLKSQSYEISCVKTQFHQEDEGDAEEDDVEAWMKAHAKEQKKEYEESVRFAKECDRNKQSYKSYKQSWQTRVNTLTTNKINELKRKMKNKYYKPSVIEKAAARKSAEDEMGDPVFDLSQNLMVVAIRAKTLNVFVSLFYMAFENGERLNHGVTTATAENFFGI